MTESIRSASPTSTAEYEDHEPFETFKDKVPRLCHLYWPSYDPEDFRVERMKGGFSNRVIGIHVQEKPAIAPGGPEVAPEPPPASQIKNTKKGDMAPSKENSTPPRDSLPPGDYVLRIPRFQSAHLAYDKRILDLASTYTEFGIPRVVAMDEDPSAANPIGQPYILQLRLPGQRLIDIWNELNQQQRILVAEQVAAFSLDIQKATNPTGGLPDFESTETSAQAIPTKDFKFIGDAEDFKKPIESQHPIEMLCARLLRWYKKYSGPGFGDGPWLGLTEMVKSMQALNGTFGPDTPIYYFHHGDLFPRNIMVATPDDKTATVTGILDWDEAHFAPAVVAFSPPAWLWVEAYWSSDVEEYIDEERIWAHAQETPKNDEAKELKDVFEKIVGTEFLQYAYSPDACEARKIWSSAKQRIGKSWVVDELSNMLAAWRSGRDGEAENVKEELTTPIDTTSMDENEVGP
jgi:aminoglycoside phosphotransferase (APT) family kinase protein